MDATYIHLRAKAREILASLPTPAFYTDHAEAVDLSKAFFDGDPVVSELQDIVAGRIENDFGHGLEHSVKVTLDAGAIMLLESDRAEYPEAYTFRRVRLAQCAGLLHDIVRKQDDHAIRGAEVAKQVLSAFRLSAEEIEDVCLAIRNHEAFKDPVEIATPEGNLLADTLYDADKFRWGPDNFYHTVWDMVDYHCIPLGDFIKRYPRGIRRLSEIRDSFHSDTGKTYGPEFIDIGLAVGDRLLEYIKSKYTHLF